MSDKLKPSQLVMGNIKGRGKPLGGAPKVNVPPLDADPVTNSDGQPITMHEQAEILKNPNSPLSPFYRPEKVMRSPISNMDPHVNRTARNGGEVPMKGNKGPFGGFVSPEDRQDPNFRPGVGSAYLANQPALKHQKEGGLSNETIKGLNALRDFSNRAHEEQNKKPKEEDQFLDDLKKFDDDFGQLNSSSFMNAYKKEINELNTDELRKAIEERLEPIDLTQFIMDGEARQDVPIVRDKFIPTFRTVTGGENLEVERMMFGSNESDIYVFDKLAIMQLTCGLYAINGNVLPDHLDERRKFDSTQFKVKFEKVVSLPLCMLASLGINFTWFDQRTRRLFIDTKPLKNG
jgi:hypothetical protein